MSQDIPLIHADSRLQMNHQESATQAVAFLRNIYKSFGRTEALKGIDLDIFSGEILALLGPNGAGKTTAISLLLGRRKPDSGVVRLFDQDPRQPSSRRHIGATPQDADFPRTLTVAEIISLVRLHYAAPLSLEETLKRFGLLGLERRQTGGLSGGQKRRLAVALAFVGNPKAVFLDEPTTGLDVEARRELWQGIRTYVNEGGTVLLTTHYLEEAEALASRVVVIDQGRVLIEGTVEAIKARVGLKRVHFEADTLPALSGVVRVEQENGGYNIYTANADEAVRELVQQNIAFKNLEVLPTSLEEAFLTLTGGTL